MASVVAESIPPLSNTTACFIAAENSKFEIQNPKQPPKAKSKCSKRIASIRTPGVLIFGHWGLFRISSFYLPVRILRAHAKRDSPARRKLRDHDRFPRCAGFDEIVQDPVRNGFVEGAFAAVGSEIKLERLALDAEPVGHIVDFD